MSRFPYSTATARVALTMETGHGYRYPIANSTAIARRIRIVRQTTRIVDRLPQPVADGQVSRYGQASPEGAVLGCIPPTRHTCTLSLFAQAVHRIRLRTGRVSTFEVDSNGGHQPAPLSRSLRTAGFVLGKHCSRLLIYWWYDRSRARLGRGDWRGRSLSGFPPRFGVALIWHASCRSPWRGEAQEGSAQLEVALPSSPTALRSERGATP
jgi:hypothetical protein